MAKNITSSILMIIVAYIIIVIFSDGRNIAVAKKHKQPNKTKVKSGCGKVVDDSADLRAEALRSMDYAIDTATTDKAPNKCVMVDGSTVYAVANCSAKVTTKGCRLCLFNAQFRVIDVDCPQKYGGWIQLVDCYLRYDLFKFCP